MSCGIASNLPINEILNGIPELVLTTSPTESPANSEYTPLNSGNSNILLTLSDESTGT